MKSRVYIFADGAKTLSIVTFSVRTLSIPLITILSKPTVSIMVLVMTLSRLTFSITHSADVLNCHTQHMPNLVVLYFYAECH